LLGLGELTGEGGGIRCVSSLESRGERVKSAREEEVAPRRDVIKKGKGISGGHAKPLRKSLGGKKGIDSVMGKGHP